MKSLKTTLLTALTLAAISPLANAQTTATTPPVGFITVPITGAGSSSVKYNLVGVNLVTEIKFQGLSGTASGTSIPLTGITAANFPTSDKYYLEVLSGANAGLLVDVASVADGSVTTVENISALVSNGTSVAIRKHNTLASVFGSSSTLLQEGEDPSLADEVQIFNPITQSGKNYYFSNLVGYWTESGGLFTDDSNTVIYPDQGLIIIRKGSADLSLKVLGSVKTGSTVSSVEPGFNIISYPYPVESSLADSGLVNLGNLSSSLTPGEDPSLADEVQIFDPTTQSGKNYYYSSLVDYWTESGGNFEDAGSTIKLPIGGSVIIIRKSPTPAAISLPQPF